MTIKKFIKVQDAELVSLTVICECGNPVILDKSEIDIYSSSSPCEICGSHGSTTIEFTCPTCKGYKTITLNEW